MKNKKLKGNIDRGQNSDFEESIDNLFGFIDFSRT